MLRLAGERTDGTILWLADERAIGSHIVPSITAAAEAAGRPAPRIVAGVPVCLCGDDEVDVAVARANRVLSEAEVSPNYQQLLDHGDARTVGDILAAGSEASIEKRLRSFADAGTTDVSVRVVPIGETRDERWPRRGAPASSSPRSPRRAEAAGPPWTSARTCRRPGSQRSAVLGDAYVEAPPPTRTRSRPSSRTTSRRWRGASGLAAAR